MKNLTVVIHGEQGSGKTTLAKKIQDMLFNEGVTSAIIEEDGSTEFNGESVLILTKQGE